MVKQLFKKLTGIPNSAGIMIQHTVMSQWVKTVAGIAVCGIVLLFAGIGKPWRAELTIQLWIGVLVAGVAFYKLGRFMPGFRLQAESSIHQASWETLSTRENEIAMLLLSELSNKEICATLFIEYNTLKTHIRNIYRKTGCGSRKELTIRYANKKNETNT